MNFLKTFALFSMIFLMVSCGSTTTHNLPSDITKIEFSATEGVIGDFITIDLSSSPFTGTAEFGSADQSATETCHLTLNLTSTQSTDLSNLLAAATYCTQACNSAAGNTNLITITSGSGTLIITKSNALSIGACSNNNFNYFCPAVTALYTLIEDIIQANSDFSTCPSEWQNMFN
jgi:hypothetical protein